MVTRVLFIEPRMLVRELLLPLFHSLEGSVEVYPHSCIDSALKSIYLFRRLRTATPRNLFLFGGIPYLRAAVKIERVKNCCPSSKIVLFDDRPRRGCGYLARKTSIHGYVSLADSSSHFCEIVGRVAHNSAAVSPGGRDWLRIGPLDSELACRECFSEDPIHSLSEAEWRCYKDLISHRRMESNDGMSRRIMSRFGVGDRFELLHQARDWGLVE